MKASQKARATRERAQLKAEQSRRTKHALAQLKRKKLYKGDARKAPTHYGKSLVAKLSDVLKGKAAVITTTRTTARKYREAGFKVRGNKIIVPKEKGERYKISKSGEITSTRRTLTGQKVKKHVEPSKRETVRDLPTHAPNGNRYQYAVPFKRGRDAFERFRFPDKESLQHFMQPGYDKRYPDWLQYVELEEILPNGELTDDETEDEI